MVAPIRFLVLMWLWLAGLSSLADTVQWKDFRPVPDGAPDELRYEATVAIGPGVKLPITIDVTARGNGTLKAANLSLRVVDQHDDAQVYEGGLLHVEFVDVTGDGFKDLVVTGIVVHTGDREGDPVSREAVTKIYAYQRDKGEFKMVFACGPDLDI